MGQDKQAAASKQADQEHPMSGVKPDDQTLVKAVRDSVEKGGPEEIYGQGNAPGRTD